jgi:hypothetical protein
MKNKKHHTVRTVRKSNGKNLREARYVPLTHKYVTTYSSDLVEVLQLKVVEVN